MPTMSSIYSALALFIMLSHCLADAQQTSNLAERLGYDNSARLLIIHADDFGVSDEVNEAVIELMKQGTVTSASIMIPCPAADVAIQYAKLNPQYDFGLHLTFNSEYSDYKWAPIQSKSQVPSLYMGDYFFEGEVGLLLWAEDEELEQEMRAQIEKALIMGMHPSHIDTHMGAIFLSRAWFNAYLQAAKDYQIPPMVPKWSEHLDEQLGLKKLLMIDKDTLQVAYKNDYLVLDYLILRANSNDYDTRKAEYLRMLSELQPGVTQLIVHPSTDASLKKRNYLDYMILKDPEFQIELKNSNIKLINWKDIQSRYDWDKVVAP